MLQFFVRSKATSAFVRVFVVWPILVFASPLDCRRATLRNKSQGGKQMKGISRWFIVESGLCTRPEDCQIWGTCSETAAEAEKKGGGGGGRGRGSAWPVSLERGCADTLGCGAVGEGDTMEGLTRRCRVWS